MDYVFTSPAGDRHALGLGVSFTPSTPGCPTEDTISGGDSVYQANLLNSGAGPLYVHDRDGTTYTFERAGGCGSVQIPFSIEDRNGNIVTYSADPNCTAAISMTDTAGRVAVSTSGFGKTGNTVTLSGLARPYQLTWATVPAQFSMGTPLRLRRRAAMNVGSHSPAHHKM